MKPGLEPGPEDGKATENLRVGLWFAMVAMAGNIVTPWIASWEGAPLSSRSMSARFLVAVAGIVGGVVVLSNYHLRARLPVSPALAIILFGLTALSTTPWGELGPGTIGLGAVMLIPTLAKLSKR